MFFFLSKILSFIFAPFLWALILIIWAFFAKKPNRKRNLVIIAFIILVLFSNRFIFNEIVNKWEVIPPKPEKTERFEYIVVLGGFSKYETSQKRMQLTSAGDRIWQAFYLYKTGKGKKLFISGGSGKLLHQEQTESDKVKQFLLSLKVPENDIIVEEMSRNTHENAQYTMEWIKKHDSTANCILVTSAMHMRRALGCFKKFDKNISAFAADINGEPRNFDPDNLIKPSPQTLSDWEKLIKEMVGNLTYNIMGYK